MNKEISELIQLEAKIYGSNYSEQAANSYPMTNGALECGLTEKEFLLITMLASNGENLIQKLLYSRGNPTDLELKLWEYLDSAINKLPIENKVDCVYRMTANSYFQTSQIHTMVEVPFYMTASLMELSTDCPVEYKIELANNTKARSLYMVFEVVPQLPEFQVEFPRNTKFFVDDIIQMNGNTVVLLAEQVGQGQVPEPSKYN